MLHDEGLEIDGFIHLPRLLIATDKVAGIIHAVSNQLDGSLVRVDGDIQVSGSNPGNVHDHLVDFIRVEYFGFGCRAIG